MWAAWHIDRRIASAQRRRTLSGGLAMYLVGATLFWQPVTLGDGYHSFHEGETLHKKKGNL